MHPGCDSILANAHSTPVTAINAIFNVPGRGMTGQAWKVDIVWYAASMPAQSFAEGVMAVAPVLACGIVPCGTGVVTGGGASVRRGPCLPFTVVGTSTGAPIPHAARVAPACGVVDSFVPPEPQLARAASAKGSRQV